MWEELKIFLLAMAPIGELRASIPVALLVYNMNWLEAFLLSFFGNLVPVFFILLFINPISKFLSEKYVAMKSFFDWLFEKTRKKHKETIEKYGFFGLIAFVAIPLPLTGAWTGALIAFLFGMKFLKSFLAISIGVLIAGVVVTLVVKAGVAVGDYFGYKTLIGIILAIVAIWLLYTHFKKRKKI